MVKKNLVDRLEPVVEEYRAAYQRVRMSEWNQFAPAKSAYRWTETCLQTIRSMGSAGIHSAADYLREIRRLACVLPAEREYPDPVDARDRVAAVVRELLAGRPLNE